jgi:aminomethyltransferase
MQYIITNDLKKIKKGKQGIYTCLCNKDGKIVDDIIVYYLSDTHFYFITNTLSRERVLNWLNSLECLSDYCVSINDVTNTVAYISIQGPKSRKLMTSIFGQEVVGLKYFDMTFINIDNIKVLITRTGYTGELGYELHFPSEYGYSMWNYIVEHGQNLGLKPIGGQAVQVLRSEKAYRAYGTDMDISNNPFEAGLGWVVNLDKEGDFIGKSALVTQKNIKKKLYSFELNLKDESNLPLKGIKILANNSIAGYLTTIVKSNTLNKIIAMGYLEKKYFNETSFLIEGDLGKAIKVDQVFYDPQGKKVKNNDTE